MKTKIFKFVLSVFTIVMAVSFAFATDTMPVDQIAYYFHPINGWQSTLVGDECGVEGTIDCKFMGLQLYSLPSTNSTQLRKF